MYPMIRALGRHRIPVSLIIIEVALAFSLIVNVLNLISGYASHTNVLMGIDAENLFLLSSSSISLSNSTPNASQEADVAALLRAVEVKNAAMVSALPLSAMSAYNFKVASSEGLGAAKVSAGMYFWTRGSLDTLGARLQAGRDFLPLEYVEYSFFGSTPPPSVVLITAALARRLYGTDSAVGKSIKLELRGHPSAIIVGVISQLISPILHFKPEDDFNVVFPVLHVAGIYAIRAKPGFGDAALAAAKAALYATDPNRVITQSESFKVMERAYFRGDRSLIWILSILAGCLTMLTGVGIVSISNYWVAQRQRAIGIRRALGANQLDIVKYFLLENLLLMLSGAVMGLAGTVGLNIALMHWFEVSRLSLDRPLVGLILFVALGQIVVLLPAIKASHIRPSVISSAD